MRKKILHVCLSESWGGLEMAVSKWNEILQENGHYNMNICTPGSPLARDLKRKAFSVFEWDSAHYFAPDFTLKLRRLVIDKQFDVVILQNLRDLWIVSPALCKIKNVKLVGFAQMLLGIKKTDWLHRLVYTRLDHLLTLTDWQIQALMPYLPVPAYKYDTIPNFVDTEKFHPQWRDKDFRYQLGFKDEDFVIGVVGRIDKQKGQMELLKAFAKLSKTFTGTHLMIVGEPTRGEVKQEKYFEQLKHWVNQTKLDSRVHFLGFQDEPYRLFANFDLFVLPSHEETFGFVVVEAMASGTPVLGTRAGGVPEILCQGEVGFLCQAQSSQALGKALQEILENETLRVEKTEKALLRAREFYDRHKVYERFINLIS